MIQESLAALNLINEPESALMIGDSFRDVQSAHTAHVPAILVQSGYGDAAAILEKSQHLDPSIQAFKDLTTAIDAVLGN